MSTLLGKADDIYESYVCDDLTMAERRSLKKAAHMFLSLEDDGIDCLLASMHANGINDAHDAVEFMNAVSDEKCVLMVQREAKMAPLVWRLTHHNPYITFVAAHMLTTMLYENGENADTIYKLFVEDIANTGNGDYTNLFVGYRIEGWSHKDRKFEEVSPIYSYRKRLNDADIFRFHLYGITISKNPVYVEHIQNGRYGSQSFAYPYLEMYRLFENNAAIYMQKIGYETVAYVLNYPAACISRFGLTRNRVLQYLVDFTDNKKKYGWFLELIGTIEHIDGKAMLDKITERWVDEHYGYPIDFLIESATTELYQYKNAVLELLAHVHRYISPFSDHTCSQKSLCGIFTPPHEKEALYGVLYRMFSLHKKYLERGNGTVLMMHDMVDMLNNTPAFFFQLITYHRENAMTITDSYLSEYSHNPHDFRVSLLRKIHRILASGDEQMLFRLIVWIHACALRYDGNASLQDIKMSDGDDYIFHDAIPKEYKFNFAVCDDIAVNDIRNCGGGDLPDIDALLLS